jgi:hypothetical protein
MHGGGVFPGGCEGKRYYPRRRRAVWFSILRAEGAYGAGAEGRAYRIAAARSSLWRR